MSNKNGAVGQVKRNVMRQGCCLLLLGTLAACNSHTESSSIGLTAVTFSGTVTDASTGTPIAGARVTAQDRSALTATSGTYSVSELRPGDYTVKVTHPDYLEAQRIVTAQIFTPKVDFQLQPK